MKLSNRAVLALALAVAVTQASCGSNDPERVGRPPVVDSFYPTTRFLNAFVGDTLQFTIHAHDPDNDHLSTSYQMGSKHVFDGRDFDYAIVDTGVVDIRGSVSDGQHTSYIDWRVSSKIPINFPPVVETAVPVEPNPVLVVGHWLNFAVVASDPESLPLSYSFSVNDSVVVNERQFSYEATSVGKKTVRVTITDGTNVVTRTWQLKVTTIPDDIPPAQVPITLAETGAQPGEINIAWTAVGRDGMTGLPSFYQVRTSPVPFTTEQDWARGSERPNVPAPLPPGETMSMVVGGLQPARETYVGVRATDDFGNISPLPQPTLVTTKGMRFGGRVIDTVTGEGVPNATLTFGTSTVTSDGDGIYEFTEQGYADGILTARDELGPDIGDYFDYSKPYSVQHLDVVNMYLIPNYPLQTTYYQDFLEFFRSMTDVGGIPYNADQRRRDIPLALYIRPFEKDGLDYAGAIREAAQGFDALLGTQVFRILGENDPLPSQRVETTYSGTVSADNHQVLTWTTDWYPLTSRIEFRTVYSAPVKDAFEVICRHELGHSAGPQPQPRPQPPHGGRPVTQGNHPDQRRGRCSQDLPPHSTRLERPPLRA